MTISSDGNHPAGVREHLLCKTCGRHEVECIGDWRVWEDSIWNGQDVFYFPSSLYIIVTDKVANLLSDLNVDNVSLRELVPGERALARLWWEDDDEGDDFEEELPPPPRGPAVAGKLSREADRVLIARLLEEQHLTVAAVERPAPTDRISKFRRKESFITY